MWATQNRSHELEIDSDDDWHGASLYSSFRQDVGGEDARVESSTLDQDDERYSDDLDQSNDFAKNAVEQDYRHFSGVGLQFLHQDLIFTQRISVH
uniref:Uncharacterized protein n=1 Tax=Kalanchoe fedtschenkoi TaxID=63787 RepID=A0A7N0VMD8_KALFE